MRCRGLRFRRAGWFAALGSLAGLIASMALAAPGNAQTGEREYAVTFEPTCVVAPGALNIKSKIKVTTRASGPTEASAGESVSFHDASSTITSPTELTESFVDLGANEVKGDVLDFVLDGSGVEPDTINVAKPSEYPNGLPFFAPVEEGKEEVFNIPSLKLGETGLTYTFGPETVTATSGNVVATVDDSPGYTEPEPGKYRATGEGIVTEVEGRKEGSHIIGPLTVACTAPEGVVAASIPVRPSTASSTTTSSSSTTTTSSATTTTTTTSSASSSSEGLRITFHEWTLAGSLTDHKLNETINLPKGCTFNGEAVIPGALEGSTFCPPFTANLALLGVVPSSVGLNIVQAEPEKGTITSGKTTGDLLFKATAKDYIEITQVGSPTLGVGVTTSCKTVEPVVFALETEAPTSSLATGAEFKGETTLPSVKCAGVLGAALGPVVTAAFSGANNPFTFSIRP